MAKINVLPRQVAELIAAGEVVERPASVIKELVENSIDAGSTAITVEIQRGGVTYMRVTDNGCGIAADEVKTAFLRHATSKLKTENDLNSIGTLGFRGEALAAVSSVARVEILTATEDSISGIRYAISGGVEDDFSEVGCPKGTTIIVRDIFFNTPARMKFLKTDVAESNAVAQIIDRIALSHPEIAFKFIRDGKQTLTTNGDGKLSSAIYAVLGRDFYSGLIPAENSQDGVGVSGYVCKPVYCRPNRNGQYFFLNGRLVKSGTAMAALEQAYKNSAMVGKFPYCVLNITVPFEAVDVNVHPAKTEVRFTDEKRVFSAIYYAVKNALMQGDSRPEMRIDVQKNRRFEHMSVEQFRQTAISEASRPAPKAAAPIPKSEPKGSPIVQTEHRVFKTEVSVPESKPLRLSDSGVEVYSAMLKNTPVEAKPQKAEPKPINPEPQKVIESELPKTEKTEAPVRDVKYIGEVFSTYIVAQMEDAVYLIDKHAAHERIIFEKLKESAKPEQQLLLSSVAVTLTGDEHTAIVENIPLLQKFGFEVEDFGAGSVLVTAVPSVLSDTDIKSVISEIAQSINNTGAVSVERLDDIYHIVACRSAVKAGNLSTAYDLSELAKRVLSSDDIMYCPHGRPVAMKLTRREIEKQFGRIQ
ncbi:MAG: DNA mismatch repair endonuclease MutL [Clostridia bacterium]|nr:DNA mismatch repair endonuclease MutL [Clostridia bacterium]